MRTCIYVLSLCLSLFFGVNIMGALPPTPIEMTTPYLNDGPTYARFTELNNRLQSEGKPKAMPYSTDSKDSYDSDGMPYKNFFEDATFMPTQEQWEQCAKHPPISGSGYNYYPFSATTCAIVVKAGDTYALQDPDGKTLVSAGMKSTAQPSPENGYNQPYIASGWDPKRPKPRGMPGPGRDQRFPCAPESGCEWNNYIIHYTFRPTQKDWDRCTALNTEDRFYFPYSTTQCAQSIKTQGPTETIPYDTYVLMDPKGNLLTSSSQKLARGIF